MTKEELLKKIDFEKSWLYECGIFGSDIDIAFHAIKNSVIEALEKEPKTGHWIVEAGDRETGYGGCTMCSECSGEGDTEMDYCPNCGAKMVEPQERSDKE